MSIKKDSNTSRAALKRFRDSLIADDDNPAPESTDLDAHEELFYGALSQLRTIRVPGKKELNLEEAFEAALRQYEVFQKWCDSGKPIGEIRGCVEGNEVFRVLKPADFYEIAFGVPPTDSAVLQITTEVDGDVVVLYNLRLQDVPPDGMTHVERWPNGQNISLTIARQMRAIASQGSTTHSSEAEFCIKIAANSKLVDNKSLAEDQSLESEVNVHCEIEEDEAPAPDTNNYRVKFPFFNWQIWLTPFSSPRARFASIMALAVVPLVFTLLDISLRAHREVPAHNNQVAAVKNQLAVATIAQQPNESLSREAGKEMTKEPASNISAPLSTAKSPVLRNHAKQEQAKDRNVRVSWHWILPMPRFDEETKAVMSDKDSDLAKRSRTHDIARYDFFARQWSSERSRFATLAALPQVSVRLKDLAITEATDAQSLRSMFALAFEASSRFRVLDDSDDSKADVVIGLRYERNEPNVGLVFVYMRDANGRFIWQDYADCEKAAGTDQDAMFSVAAERLVTNLEKAIDISKQPQVVRRRG